MVLIFILLRVLFIFACMHDVSLPFNSFRFCTFPVFLRCSGFSWGCSGFFGRCSWFSWECSWFLGAVPGFSGVPECSVMFRCSGVPCSGVPGSTTCHQIVGFVGFNLVPRVLSLPRESTLVTAGHVSMHANSSHTEGGSST